MEEDKEKVVSAQKTLQSVHDSGWNDPPSWALQKAAASTPTKRLLNKRVAFPLNSKAESSTSVMPNLPPIGNLPPPPEPSKLTTAPHKPTLAPSGICSEDPTSELNLSKDEALKNTLENLNSVINRLDSSKTQDIHKRLEKMELMWKEDKLNSIIHKKLFEISMALNNNDAEKADQLHITLMMNNASICSSWVPGIRQLITEVKNNKL